MSFWTDGRWARFDAFVEQFETNPRSWLRWAQDNDVDRYAAADAAGKLKKGSGQVETFEWSQEATQLNTVITQLAQLIHVTTQKGAPKGKQKKFTPPKVVWPYTAMDGLKKRARSAHEKATKAFMSMFEFVPEAEFLADVAEHEAAVAAGLPSPVEQRAEAQAQAARDEPMSDAEWLGVAPVARADE